MTTESADRDVSQRSHKTLNMDKLRVTMDESVEDASQLGAI